MGKKYGSLHVRLVKTSEEINAVISGCINAIDAIPCVDVGQVAMQLGLNLCQQQIPILNHLVQAGISSGAKQTIAEHNGFVSVYDSRVTFENIQSIAQKLSNALNLPVCFTSVYDDDAFLFGLCENGATTSVHASGNCEAYGMMREHYNIEGLERYLANGKKISTELTNLSGTNFESALVDAFGFRLDHE